LSVRGLFAGKGTENPHDVPEPTRSQRSFRPSPLFRLQQLGPACARRCSRLGCNRDDVPSHGHGPGWGYDQYRPVGPNRDAGTVAIYFAACADAEPDHRAAADTGPDSVGQGFVTEVGVMSYHAHRDQDRNPSHSEQTRVRSMVPFVLSAVAAIALIAVLSPRFREVHHAPAVYAEAIAPGPIPSTERRLSQTPIK